MINNPKKGDSLPQVTIKMGLFTTYNIKKVADLYIIKLAVWVVTANVTA